MARCLQNCGETLDTASFLASRSFFWCEVGSWSPSLTLRARKRTFAAACKRSCGYKHEARASGPSEQSPPMLIILPIFMAPDTFSDFFESAFFE
jgi:hypothetical protein